MNAAEIAAAPWRARAGFVGSFSEFLDMSVAEVRDALQAFVAALHESQYLAQVPAWGAELDALRGAVADACLRRPALHSAGLVLEFGIPRRGRFIDAVALINDTVLVLEFKTGGLESAPGGLLQAREYALDLRDFHAASRNRHLVPLVVPLSWRAYTPASGPGSGAETRIGIVAAEGLADFLVRTLDSSGLYATDAQSWASSPYAPTPSILESAGVLFGGHSVREIAHAAADDALATVEELHRIVDEASTRHERVLAVVTGVPGSGKTLVGLTLVHQLVSANVPSVFLSGNGPLVNVLIESLSRDEATHGATRAEARHKVTATIQSVMRFLREHVGGHPPPEHVVVFDEAQRAWNRRQMVRKNAQSPLLHDAEPDLLLSVMLAPSQWSVVVALVGGGQEIFDGEAGLTAWGDAVTKSGGPWKIVASPEALRGGPSVVGQQLFHSDEVAPALSKPSLHLRTSIRSARARAVSEWVHAVVSGNAEEARELMPDKEFPIELTRDLAGAREWLRLRAGDTMTIPGAIGLVASSDALRLRADGLEVSNGFKKGYPWAEWFTRASNDVRSSSRLEVAASEFEIQGLELDWVGVCWGGDFFREDGRWQYRAWRGAKWQNVNDTRQREYLVNRYRVLLTRARRGIVVWVPRGDAADDTRNPRHMDTTAAFLASCGMMSDGK